MDAADLLPPLPDAGFRRVLCVAAHPDDLEYGTSAAVARWTGRGAEVAYLLVTRGEAGMRRPPAEAGPLREAEERAAARAVGAGGVAFLGHPDGTLEPSLGLRRDIARAIRRFRPDAVVTVCWDAEAGWGLNQADHRAAGLAAADAVSAAGNRWIFPELVDEGLEPWEADWLLVAGSPRPTHAVAVSDDDAAAAVASLEAHREYLADLPDHPAPADFIPAMLREAGARAGVPLAVGFRAFRLRG